MPGTNGLEVDDMVIEGTAFDTAELAGDGYGAGEEKDKARKVFGPQDAFNELDGRFTDIEDGEGFIFDWSFPLVEQAVQFVLIASFIIIPIHPTSPPRNSIPEPERFGASHVILQENKHESSFIILLLSE